MILVRDFGTSFNHGLDRRERQQGRRKKRRGKKVESGIKLMIIQKGEERAKEVIQEMATVK